MKATPPTLVRTLGAVLAVAVVLAVAGLYLEGQKSPGSDQTASTLPRLLYPQAASGSADYAILDSQNLSLGARKRVAVDIMLNASATADNAAQALVHAAQALQRRDRALGAIAVTAFKVDPRAHHARRPVARLLWSPDGKGWDGVSRRDFAKHIIREPARAR